MHLLSSKHLRSGRYILHKHSQYPETLRQHRNVIYKTSTPLQLQHNKSNFREVDITMSPKTHRSMISTNTRADSLRPIYSGVPKIRKGNTSSHKLSKKTGLAGLDIVGHNDHDQNKIACKGFDSPSEHSLPQFEPVTKNWVPFDVYHEISQNKYHRRHLNLQRYLCGTSTGLQWINEDLLQVDILQKWVANVW